MDRNFHLKLLSIKRWLLVDGKTKQPEFSVEPIKINSLVLKMVNGQTLVHGKSARSENLS
jgi:hypothetical protein